MQKSRQEILAVDDSPSNITLLEHILYDFYDILKFYEPLKAIEYLKENKVDLVISDIVMPKMNGVQLIKTIRQTHPELPIIVVSAFDKASFVNDACKEGIFKYIVKPLNIPDFYLTIEKALRIHPGIDKT